MSNALEPTVTEAAPAHFFADGRPYSGRVFEVGDGRLFGEVMKPCPSCGGHGRSYRGQVCRRCRGDREIFDQALVFTAEALHKRVIAQDRRKAKKQSAELERLGAIEDAHLACVADHLEIYARAQTERGNAFLADCLDKSVKMGGLTAAQLEAMKRILDGLDADRQMFAGSRPVGEVGEQIEIEVSGVRSWKMQMPAYQGRGMQDVFVSLLVDAAGNALTMIHKSINVVAGERVVVRGMIRETDTRNGWTATRLGRPEIVARLAAAEEPVAAGYAP